MLTCALISACRRSGGPEVFQEDAAPLSKSGRQRAKTSKAAAAAARARKEKDHELKVCLRFSHTNRLIAQLPCNPATRKLHPFVSAMQTSIPCNSLTHETFRTHFVLLVYRMRASCTCPSTRPARTSACATSGC